MIEQLNDNNKDRRRLHENKWVMDEKKRPGLGEEILDIGNNESRHRSKNAKMLVGKTTRV